MLSFPIFLTVFLFSSCSTSYNGENKAEIVNAAIKALEAAREKTGNPLADLAAIGPKASNLMKATIALSEMIADNPNPDPDSEQYAVMMDYKVRFEEIWNPKIIEVDDIAAIITTDVMMKEYRKKVSIPIQRMNDLIKQLKERTIGIDEYKEACETGDLEPGSIMEYLHSRLVDYCNNSVTLQEAQAVADHREYLMNVFLRMNVSDKELPDPGLYMSEFLSIHDQLDKTLLNREFSTFKRQFVNHDKAMHAFLEELRAQRILKNNEPVCLLRELINKFNFNHHYINAFLSKFMKEVIELAKFAQLCAEVKYQGNPESLNNKKMQNFNELVLIFNHTARWLNESLVSAWPSAHHGILKEQITREFSRLNHVYVKNTSLERVAKNTHLLLKNTGDPNYVYGMVLVKSNKTEYELHYDGMPNYCSFNKGFSGFDTVIGRIPFNPADEWDKFYSTRRLLSLGYYAETQNSTIENKISDSRGAATLQSIANKLESSREWKFVNEDDFHCWGMVREKSARPWNPCPTIDYYSSPYNYANGSSIITLNYKNEGTIFRNCEEFKMFFFV